MTEITPPAEFAAWIACAAFALMLFNQGAKGWRNLKGEAAHPPNTQLGQSVVELNRRVEALEKWREMLIRKLDSDKSEILRAGEDRAEKLHRRINYLLLGVGKIAGHIGCKIESGDEGNV